VPIRVKSVSGTRTLSVVRGSGAHSKERHVKAFQIASLELERSRRMREFQAARDRMKSLTERLREVDALIAKIREQLGNPGPIGGEERPAPPAKRQTIRYG
jgi:exonuclease VII small subunit